MSEVTHIGLLIELQRGASMGIIKGLNGEGNKKQSVLTGPTRRNLRERIKGEIIEKD